MRLLAVALLLALLAACGAGEEPAVPSPEPPPADEGLAFVRRFFDTIAAGDYETAAQDFTCLAREPGAQVDPVDVQYLEGLFPWAGLRLIDVELVGSNETGTGTTQAIYEIELETNAGARVTARLFVITDGDEPCVETQMIDF